MWIMDPAHLLEDFQKSQFGKTVRGCWSCSSPSQEEKGIEKNFGMSVWLWQFSHWIKFVRIHIRLKHTKLRAFVKVPTNNVIDNAYYKFFSHLSIINWVLGTISFISHAMQHLLQFHKMPIKTFTRPIRSNYNPPICNSLIMYSN